MWWFGGERELGVFKECTEWLLHSQLFILESGHIFLDAKNISNTNHSVGLWTSLHKASTSVG